jgi:hypothetical protein
VGLGGGDPYFCLAARSMMRIALPAHSGLWQESYARCGIGCPLSHFFIGVTVTVDVVMGLLYYFHRGRLAMKHPRSIHRLYVCVVAAGILALAWAPSPAIALVDDCVISCYDNCPNPESHWTSNGNTHHDYVFAGPHACNAFDFQSCADVHPACNRIALEKLGDSLRAAVARGDVEAVLGLMARNDTEVSIHTRRVALQVNGCARGSVSAHVPLPAALFAAVSARFNQEAIGGAVDAQPR